MVVANLGEFVGGMAVAGGDLSQVFPRHAVHPVNAFPVLPRGDQELVKGRPIVSPVRVEANPFPQFVFVDLAPPPFVEHVLVVGKDGFESQDEGTIAGLGSLFN